MNSILKTLLYEWRDRKLPEVTPRNIHLDVSRQKGINNATVITGFRRVGKTYLLFEAIQKLLETNSREEVVYINFEDERMTPASIELLTDLLPEIQAVYGKKPKILFLDELQLVPNWSKWARRILDSENIQIFITGSSSKMSSAELPTELRGRAWETQVFPLDFSEFLRFKNTSLDFDKLKHVKDEMARFRFLFDEYLIFGGLPAVVLSGNAKKQELLQSYFQTVLEKDIAERYKIDNEIALKMLLKLLLNSSYITISKLTNSLKSMNIPVGKSTIDNYLSYIKNSYFMKELYYFSPVLMNQLQYPRKVYFVDTGFMTALSTKFSKNMGRLFENVVYQELLKKNETMFYFKDKKDNEVDFVVLQDGRTSAMYQVCYDLHDAETQKREIKSFLKAGEVLNCSNLNLITIENPEGLKLPKGIKIISAPEFFLCSEYLRSI